MALTKATFSMISGMVLNAEDFGADPTGVADSTQAINDAIAYCAANYSGSGTIMFPTPNGVYRTTSTIDILYSVNLTGLPASYNYYTNAPKILYDGATADVGVLRYDATSQAHVGKKISGLIIDANSKAGICIDYNSPLGGFNISQNAVDECTLRGATNTLIRAIGNYQFADNKFWRCHLIGTVDLTYGVVFQGVNTTNNVFTECTILGNNNTTQRHINNVWLKGGAAGNQFNNCLFAGTKAQSGSDGYAVFADVGCASMMNCWAEGAGMYYQGDNIGNANNIYNAELIGCLAGGISGGFTYSIFNTAKYVQVTVIGCICPGDIGIESTVSSNDMTIINPYFLSGKGVVDMLASTEYGSQVKVLGWDGTPYANYTWTGVGQTPYFMSNWAKKHFVTLQANLADLKKRGFSENSIFFTQDATGGRTVTFEATEWVGTPPAISGAPNATTIVQNIINPNNNKAYFV